MERHQSCNTICMQLKADQSGLVHKIARPGASFVQSSLTSLVMLEAWHGEHFNPLGLLSGKTNILTQCRSEFRGSTGADQQ